MSLFNDFGQSFQDVVAVLCTIVGVILAIRKLARACLTLLSPSADPVTAPRPAGIRFVSLPVFICMWPTLVAGGAILVLHRHLPQTFTPNTSAILWLASLFMLFVPNRRLTHSAFSLLNLLLVWTVAFLAILTEHGVIDFLRTPLTHLGLLSLDRQIGTNGIVVTCCVLGGLYLAVVAWTFSENRWTLLPDRLIRKRWILPDEEYVVDAAHPASFGPVNVLTFFLSTGGRRFTYRDGKNVEHALLILLD